MPKSRGYRAKTRRLLKKDGRSGFTKNLLTLEEVKEGDKVAIIIDPSIHKGMPHRRYYGKIATVVGRRGRAFEVRASKGNKEVSLIVRPEHLKKI